MASDMSATVEGKDRENLTLFQALHMLAEATQEALDSGDADAARKIQAMTSDRITEAVSSLPRPFQTRLREAINGPESALWRDVSYEGRFALVWDLLGDFEQGLLSPKGWSQDALADLERTVPGRGPSLTAEAIGQVMVSVIAGHFGSSDHQNVLAWLMVRGYSPDPPGIEGMVGLAVVLGEWAPYTYAAGVPYREARQGAAAGTLDRAELRMLAALRGIPLP